MLKPQSLKVSLVMTRKTNWILICGKQVLSAATTHSGSAVKQAMMESLKVKL